MEDNWYLYEDNGTSDDFYDYGSSPEELITKVHACGCAWRMTR